MTSVRHALAFSFVERYLLIVLALLSNILLARLLTPEEIGLYSVSLAVIGIAQVLRDFGVGTFLIQEKNLTEAHIRTAFGFSLLIGFSLFFFVYLATPAFADFYRNDAMVITMRISALNFLILPFNTISIALLRREMAFRLLAVVNLQAAAIGFIVTVGLAFFGVGANSMAIGSVVLSIATGIAAWVVRGDRCFLVPALSEWRSILNFGGQSSLVSIITTIAINANDLVVGKVLGFHSVAIISRAQGMMNLFHRDIMAGIHNVVLPAFSSACRRNENLDYQHSKSIGVLAAFAWPFYGLMSCYAFEFMRLLFGQQWDSAVILVPIFCFAGVFSVTNALIPSLLLATGNISIHTKIQFVLQTLRFIYIVIAAVVFESVVAFALAYLLSAMTASPMFFITKNRVLPTNYEVLKVFLIKSALVTVLTLIPPVVQLFLTGFFRREPLSIEMYGPVLLASAFIWIISIKLFDHPIAHEKLYRLFENRLKLSIMRIREK